MSSTSCAREVILLSILLGVSAAPSSYVEPVWHLPCGLAQSNSATQTRDSEEELSISEYLLNVKMQHQSVLDEFLVRDFEFLYERVKIGTDDHQYIPNWIPGKKTVHEIKRRLINVNRWKIVNYMPKLHEDLQKFAVAFEELILDEENANVREALGVTQSYLMMMLCEVENGLSLLQVEKAPARVPRKIMSSDERNPIDFTKRLIRDWGVLLKYRDYLHAWKHVFLGDLS